MNNWIQNDGSYYFKFKLHGNPTFHNAIGIGIVSKEYNVAHKEGIGYDENGWSFFIWGAKSNSTGIYCVDYKKVFEFGLSDQKEFSFQIIVKNTSCSCTLDVHSHQETIQYDTIKAPVTI